MIQRTASLGDSVFQVFHRRVFKALRDALTSGAAVVNENALGQAPSFLTLVAQKQLNRLVTQAVSFADSHVLLFAPFYNRVIADIAAKEGTQLLEACSQ